ncbi:MAG: histone deacetylase [Planctomycetota bacterium]|nr:MAG: histone deacetylase [Planctomycetota bacterium]REJ96094.1 MAG: histone deacetylase [Planctomycetota bacterium]REK21866.1 MAG: histone deacetylase [Planctomycetota bacterium]REK46674.1 MAG: histone deacetylase [Planctomycetota bacterium]
MPRIVYSRKYNVGFFGLERTHAFDARKYARIWRVLRRRFGRGLASLHIRTDRQVRREELLLVHTEKYLEQLRDPRYLAAALEIPGIRNVPYWLIDHVILRCMRWATRGTMLAFEAALSEGLAFNLGGGFHHAKPDRGEGFSIYADTGIAVAELRRTGRLAEDARVVYVDTDAHQGNGVCHTFLTDNRVSIFDIFNREIYPTSDVKARARIDCEVGISNACTEAEYLAALKQRLPDFLDSVTREPVALGIYNAGTDVVEDDPLGGLNLSPAAIRERDLFAVGELRRRGIPTVMLPAGGYSQESYRLVAESVIALIETERVRKPLPA